MDFRDRIWADGKTLAEVARKVGVQEAHFHRCVSGRAPMSLALARRIDAATSGLIRWYEWFQANPGICLSGQKIAPKP